MKRFFLTAIALVAFSGASIASTIENDEVLVSTESVKEEGDYPCTEDWSADMEIYQMYGYSFEEALVWADEAFEVCLDWEYGFD